MSLTIQDLRGHLFATLDGLRDKENPMDIDRAKAVAEIAQTLINSAKVEVDLMRVAGTAVGTGFIAALPEPASQAAQRDRLTVVRDDKDGKTTVEQRGGLTITRHTQK